MGAIRYRIFNISCAKIKAYGLFLSLFLIQPFLNNLSAQLQPGDLAILGMDANLSLCGGCGGCDEISFVCFKDLTTGASFDVTDNGWERSIAGKWGDTEGTLRFTRTGGTVAKGTVITFQQTGTGGTGTYNVIAPAGGWQIDYINNPGGSALNMNSGGDQLYFMANGIWDNHGAGMQDATYSGNMLFAFNSKPTWVSFGNSTQESGLHPEVTPCFYMNPASTTDYAKYTGPMTPATQTQWIDRINDPINWTSFASCALYNATAPNYPTPVVITIQPSGMSITCIANCSGCSPVNSTLQLTLPVSGGPFTVVYGDGTNSFTLNNATNGQTVSVTSTVTSVWSLQSVTGSIGCPLYSNFLDSATITVTLPMPPPLSGVPATLCQNAGPISLPTTQSGITGNWSGTGVSSNSFNPTGLSGNITLTFTPVAGQCATANTTMIAVNIPVTPAISGIPATICEIDPPIALNTTQSGINGTWSGSGVSGNNFNPSGLSGSITLTFTPTAGQCANNNTTSITVNQAVTPTISGIPATICVTDPPIALPTVQGGINGNWSGPGVTGNTFDPMGLGNSTNTLTFTPNAGQCALDAMAFITVNNLITPVITGVPASVCQNAPPLNLNTNPSGISGNWSGPGVSSNSFNPTGLSGDITLTFTPNPGQCATSTTITFPVIIPIIPVISGIPSSLCQNAPPISLPTSQSGINGNWSGTGVTGNNFNPTGLSGNITLTFTPNAGQCATTATTDIIVNVPITPGIAGIPANLCQNAPPISLPTTQSGINGNWSGIGVSANNFNPTGLSGNITLTFTPNAGQCAIATTTSILVNIPVTPAITGIPASLCQTASPISLPTTQSGINGNWSGTGVTTNNFNPTGLSGNIVLTFTPNAGQCANVTTTNITVNIPTIPTITGIPAGICENDASIALPATQSGISGNWSGQGVTGNTFDPSGLNGNITLNFTPNAGQCAVPASTIIDVNSPPSFANLTEDCDLPGMTYTVSFTINGGDPGSYTVNGIPVGGSGFVSAPITSGTGYVFNLDDGNGCGPIVISGSVNCSCATSAGTMNFANTPLHICDGSGFTVNPEGDEVLDNDDVLEFVLHTDAGAQLGTVIAISLSTTFGFPAGIILGQTYYVSAVAGTNNGFGNVDLNDPCLSVSQGIPVIFYVPTSSISSGGVICQDDCFDFQVQFTGYAPYNLMYAVNTGANVFNLSLLSNTNTSTFSVCPADYAISSGQIQIYPTNITDFNCSFDYSAPPIQTITVHPNSVDNLTQTLCPGGNITVNGTVYDQSHPTGTEVLQNANANGCDSTIQVSLSFYPPSVFNLMQTLCTGGSLTVNGTVYDQSHPIGTEILLNAGAHGCDSTVNVNLSFSNVVTFNLNQQLCPNGSITVNGNVYNAAHPSGSETFAGGSYLGCDSVVNISLSFFPAAVFDLTQTLCTGGSITVNGTVYNSANPSGVEVLPNASSHGCDSTINVNLSFSNIVTFNLNQTLCPGTSIVVNGTTYNSGHPSGSETFIGGSTLGCDSVVNVNLSFYPPSVHNINQTLCAGGSITVNGTVYNQAHPAGTEILVNASSHGCDSTINVNLTFHNISTTNINQTLCQGGSLVVNGTTYNSGHPSGTETFVGGNHFGCDSVVNVNLSFYPPSVFNLSQSFCMGGGSITVNGTVYDENNPSGTEILSNASSHGCDSTVNIDLTYASPVVFVLDSFLEAGESIVVNGTLYSQGNPTGTEVIIGGSVAGCDSTIIVNLHFNGVVVLDISVLPPLCLGGSDGSILLENIIGAVPPLSAVFDGGNPVSILPLPYTFTGLTAGPHMLRLIDFSGTIFNQNIIVPDPDSLILDLGIDTTIQAGNNYVLTAHSSFAITSWTWTPPTFLDCTNCPQPTALMPSEDITYTLLATDANGCTASDSITIIISREKKIYVPNVFSPNGDGINEVFLIFANREISKIKNFEIFSRWGTLLYHAQDFLPNDVTKGWDGTFRNEPMDIGVYTWTAEIEYLGGLTEKIKGDVTLLR